MNKRHWEDLPDKGPPIQDTHRPNKKRGGGKKPFGIECRHIISEDHWSRKQGKTVWSWFSKWQEWHMYQKYKLEKDRDQALTTLTRKAGQVQALGRSYWEYRKAS